MKIDDWKMFEKNNSTVALNILYINEKGICPLTSQKLIWVVKKQTILLMIPNEEREQGH